MCRGRAGLEGNLSESCDWRKWRRVHWYRLEGSAQLENYVLKRVAACDMPNSWRKILSDREDLWGIKVRLREDRRHYVALFSVFSNLACKSPSRTRAPPSPVVLDSPDNLSAVLLFSIFESHRGSLTYVLSIILYSFFLFKHWYYLLSYFSSSSSLNFFSAVTRFELMETGDKKMQPSGYHGYWSYKLASQGSSAWKKDFLYSRLLRTGTYQESWGWISCFHCYPHGPIICTLHFW